jgi:hypothetical protein
LNWTIVRDAGCEDVLTATTLVGDTRAGAGAVPSLEFGVAELGWWLDGTCAAGGSHRCAANATCQDVETPSGAWGHRCACRDGTTGDGFAAGEGCRYRGGEFSSPVLPQRIQRGCWFVGPGVATSAAPPGKSSVRSNHARAT